MSIKNIPQKVLKLLAPSTPLWLCTLHTATFIFITWLLLNQLTKAKLNHMSISISVKSNHVMSLRQSIKYINNSLTFDDCLQVAGVLGALKFDFCCHLFDILNVSNVIVTLKQLLQFEQNALRFTPVGHEINQHKEMKQTWNFWKRRSRNFLLHQRSAIDGWRLWRVCSQKNKAKKVEMSGSRFQQLAHSSISTFHHTSAQTRCANWSSTRRSFSRR